MPAWEVLDDFLSLDEFAVSATFTMASGEVRAEVRGILDAPSFPAEVGEFDLAYSAPRLTCPAVAVRGLKKNDACVISEKGPDGALVEVGRYRLDHDPLSDDTGWAVIRLSPGS